MSLIKDCHQCFRFIDKDYAFIDLLHKENDNDDRLEYL